MSRYPAGVDLIKTGKCPAGRVFRWTCMFCDEGHMLECHYGMTCEEAQCDHLDQTCSYDL